VLAVRIYILQRSPIPRRLDGPRYLGDLEGCSRINNVENWPVTFQEHDVAGDLGIEVTVILVRELERFWPPQAVLQTVRSWRPSTSSVTTAK
jgi:hypothetical protein